MALVYKDYLNNLSKIKKLGTLFILCRDIPKFLFKRNNLNNTIFINKHDVECNILKAFNVARMEASLNIFSTYYLQDYILKNKSGIALARKIQEMGHEIGFHYDSLDRNKGDFKKAILDFENSLEIFKKNELIVKSLCPHGNAAIARNGWNSNKDLFYLIDQKFGDSLIDIICSKFIKDCQVSYITDASYKLSKVKSISGIHQEYQSTTFKDIIENQVTKESFIVLSTHTHRFSSSHLIIKLKKINLSILKFLYNKLKKFKLFNRIFFYVYKLGKLI